MLMTLYEWKMSCNAAMSDMVGRKRTRPRPISGLIYIVVIAIAKP
jgi:hypothetical protein